MFHTKIKQTIKDLALETIESLKSENPDIKIRLNIPLESFSIDEALEALPEFLEFVENNRPLILDKYNRLIKPKLQLLASNNQDIEKIILTDFIEDFFHYAIYKCIEFDNPDVTFDESWDFFQEEFFADENHFEFRARLKNVYYHGGVGLDNIIPWNDVSLFSASSSLDYRIMGWERERSRMYQFLDYFQPVWLILKKKATITSNKGIMSVCREAENQFNLFTFVVRNICKGGAFFNDIRVFGLGYLSPHSNFGASWHAIPDNDIYEEFEEFTTIENPWDSSISKVLDKCDPLAYKEFVFADWNVRLNSQFNLSFDSEYSLIRKQFYFYERVLNLSFVLNSLLPDMKNSRGYPDFRKNKLLREDYLSKVLAIITRMDEVKIKETINNFYELRNKIAHGNSVEAKSLLNSMGNDVTINEKIRFFNYIVSKIILISLANDDFKIKMEIYCDSGDLSLLPSLVNPFS